jgi:hypothetical protein
LSVAPTLRVASSPGFAPSRVGGFLGRPQSNRLDMAPANAMFTADLLHRKLVFDSPGPTSFKV